jgi:hypothetical protein
MMIDIVVLLLFIAMCADFFITYRHFQFHKQAITACYAGTTAVKDNLINKMHSSHDVLKVVENRTHLLTTRAESIEQQLAHHEDAIANHKQYLTDILVVLKKLHPEDKA